MSGLAEVNMWKPGHYKNANSIHEYNSDGRVRNIKTKKELSPVIDSHGYQQISFTNNEGKHKVAKVHRQIALLFLDNHKGKPCVNHKNGVRHDNNIENLEWCTYSENNTHAYRELSKGTNFSKLKGALHYKSTPVSQYKNGEYVATFCSTKEAQDITGVAQQNISKVVNGKRPLAGGYNWRVASTSGV